MRWAFEFAMVTYQYIARTLKGEEVAGIMQADNETAVVRTLGERELFPVSVTEQGAAKRVGGRARRIRIRDIGLMYGQLSDLLGAGVPMLRALETLTRAVVNPSLAGKVLELRDAVAGGNALADAMAEHPDVFNSFHAAMVRAGEKAGFLEDVLGNLAGFLERQDELRSKVRSAMIYPMVLTIVGAMAMFVMLTFIVPRFKPFFVRVALPMPTRILFAASDALVHHAWLLGCVILLMVLGMRSLLRSQRGQRFWDHWRVKVPGLGRVIRTVSITRFCRILGTMLANGVPILQALEISKDATGSAVLSDSIEEAMENVRSGETLASPLAVSGLFPAEIVEMIAVAEESNQLDKVLVQISDSVERRTNRQVDAAVRLVEPLILMVIAGVIGFVAIGLMYPIFTMSQVLR